MPRTRVFGLATILVGALALAHLAAGCSGKGHSGDECTKDFDCESGHCVQYVCMQPGASQIEAGPATTADAATEAATSDASAD